MISDLSTFDDAKAFLYLFFSSEPINCILYESCKVTACKQWYVRDVILHDRERKEEYVFVMIRQGKVVMPGNEPAQKSSRWADHC